MEEAVKKAAPPPTPPALPEQTAGKPKLTPTPSPWKSNATFEERIQELEHFRKGNGHCRVPLRQPGLGRWVGEMRATYKLVQAGAGDTVLTPEYIALLDAKGFEWSLGKPMVPWETRFADLLKFKEKKGNCNVPRSYKEDPSLGEWVHMQRKCL